MTNIKAPYNFIPLSEKVVYPSWEKAVNHDIPFEDGETGTIKVRIKTHSPIFVRNGGQSRKDQADKFFESNGKYYIPGSSLKGMLRSVVEVMTFSKMQRTNNDKYSVRDFQNKDIYPMLDLAKEVKVAWLRKEGDKYYMQDCGVPGRIPHHWIDDAFGTKLKPFYKKGGGFNGNKEDHKSAKYKYQQFGNIDRTTGFVSAEYGEDNSVDVRKFYKVDPLSNKRGTLVFTGQSGPRNEQKGERPSGKIHEFIFFETNNKAFEVSEEVIKNFFFAYFDHDKNRQSLDWKFWKKKLNSGEQIPVFFRYENKKKQTIKDMGLSYLYKIIYNKSVLDSVPDSHKKDERDFSETIFGYIDKTQSLKGRVHIGHAKAINEGITLNPETAVLSGPKASYYPNYIRQNGKKGLTKKYVTFMDDTAIIAGWKRYPVHKNGVRHNPGSTDNNRVETSFVPLKEGVEFEFHIRVHNLRKAEIGAIISAIIFHDTSNTYHSIGMAKPLGYGKSTLEIVSLEGFKYDSIAYLKGFESYMNYALGYRNMEWHNSAQITELITMVSEHNNSSKSELGYMKMDTKGDNEFVQAKKSKEYLDNYSKLVTSIIPESLITQTDIADCYKSEKALENKFQNADLKQLKQKTIAEAKSIVTERIEEQRSALITLLDKSLENVENTITTVGKKIKANSVSAGLMLDMVIPSNKRAFDNMKKEVEKFITAKTGVNNIKKLVKEKPQGILDVEYTNVVLSKSTEIVKALKKGDQEKKAKVYANKISEWLGQETAQQWYNELIKK